MNTHLERQYFIISTTSGETLGLLSLIRPKSDASIYHFSLHRPQDRNRPDEFLDLEYVMIDFPEFETHNEVFETQEELEVVHSFYSSTNMTNELYITLRKKEDE